MSEQDPKLVISSDGIITKYDDIMTTTRTVIAMTNLTIDIQKFFKYMPITQYTPIEKRRGRKRRVQPPVHIEKLQSGSIISMKYGDNTKGAILKKKKYKKSTMTTITTPMNTIVKKNDDYFRHSVSCVMMLEDNKQINIKVPTNGKLQMTGCKTDNHSVEAVIHLYKIMQEVEKWTNEKLFVYNNEKRKEKRSEEQEVLRVTYNVVMQNKDFKIGFRINRQNLDRFINTKTNFYSIFEASTSTGINIKIENKNIKNRSLLHIEYDYRNDLTKTTQIPYNEYYELLDEKDKELEQEKKYLTFFVFSSGSIIMSGRESNMRELFYEVVNILIKNRDEFEEKAFDRKNKKVKKEKRTKIEIESSESEDC